MKTELKEQSNWLKMVFSFDLKDVSNKMLKFYLYFI